MIPLDSADNLDGIKNKKVIYSLARKTDVVSLIEFMKRYPQTAFCEWQDRQLINKAIEDQAGIIILGKLGTRIIGAVIAGIMGTRATINHLAVDADYRKQGIGRHLVNCALHEIKLHGVQRVFLFVDNTNENATSFWLSHDFNLVANETTMEKDI